MIIILDTEKIAQELLQDGEWKLEDFQNNNAPDGWTNGLLEAVPNLEMAVYHECLNLLSSRENKEK